MTAFIGAKAAAHPGPLTEPDRSLLAQAGAVPGRFQDDGWGLAWFGRDGRPRLARSVRPARLQGREFRRAAAKASSRVVLAHLRDASNPKKVKKSLLISRENTQPFTAAGFAFCHNGTLFIKDEIRSVLGRHAAGLKGTNDSEVLFRQVLKMLDIYGSPAKALEMALDEIRTVWVSCRDRYPGLEGPYRGLNVFLASRDSLTVLCHGDSKKTALMTPGWNFGTIAWKASPSGAVFSSEPVDSGKGWKKMKDLQIAEASVSGGRVQVKLSEIDGGTL